MLREDTIFTNAPDFDTNVAQVFWLKILRVFFFPSRSLVAFLSSLGQEFLTNRSSNLCVFVTEPSIDTKYKIDDGFNTELVVNLLQINEYMKLKNIKDHHAYFCHHLPIICPNCHHHESMFFLGSLSVCMRVFLLGTQYSMRVMHYNLPTHFSIWGFQVSFPFFPQNRVLRVPSSRSPFPAWTWLWLFWPAQLARQVEFLFVKMKTFQSSDRLNQGFPLGVGVRDLHLNKLPSNFTHPGVADHELLHDPR